jgi:hypothetical protein
MSLRAAVIAILMMMAAVLPLGSAVMAQDAATGTPPAVAPESGPQFVLYPAGGNDGEFFTLDADPGSSHELKVVLGNADDEPLDLRAYVNDVVPMVNGGFAVAEEAVAPTGTATWIDFSAETYAFAPGEGIERAFTVTVPEGTAPGQYIAGLVLQTLEPIEVEGSAMFQQIIRKSIAVFITVPGPASPSFVLGEPALEPSGVTQLLVIPVENTGNVLVRPTGEAVLTDANGAVVMTAPITMGSVYAGIGTTLAIPLQADIEPGDYTLALQVQDPETGVGAELQGYQLAITEVEDSPDIWAMDATVVLAPDLAAPVYADVEALITNNGPVTNVEIELDVIRDGELVETFSLAPSLSVATGTTPYIQRYVPPTGFEAGTWTFVLRLNVVDGSTGSVTTVLTIDDIPPVDVG